MNCELPPTPKITPAPSAPGREVKEAPSDSPWKPFRATWSQSLSLFKQPGFYSLSEVRARSCSEQHFIKSEGDF